MSHFKVDPDNIRTEAARRRTIEKFVDMLRRGETIYPQSRR